MHCKNISTVKLFCFKLKAYQKYMCTSKCIMNLLALKVNKFWDYLLYICFGNSRLKYCLRDITSCYTSPKKIKHSSQAQYPILSIFDCILQFYFYAISCDRMMFSENVIIKIQRQKEIIWLRCIVGARSAQVYSALNLFLPCPPKWRWCNIWIST